MTGKVKKLSDKEKDLSIEERARRAAYRISKKYENHNAEEPDQAAAEKTNEKGEMDHGNRKRNGFFRRVF